MGQFLGLDSSTQSLSAVVIDTDTGAVVFDGGVSFGSDLAEFNCPNGFLPGTDALVRHSDPLMWVAALEKLLADAEAAGVEWARIQGISGSGQQHGSVYLNERFFDAVAFSPGTPLVEQLRPCLSRKTAPIWMDSSTTAQCEAIAAAVGGNEVVSRITGSRMIERFTGPQIRKFAEEDPAGYAATARIHLVSSFMASVLAGADGKIDLGDGAGMNLLDLSTGDWHEGLLEATAPGLRARLSGPVAGGTQIGTLAEYFVKTYGFTAGTPVFAWSGDNPCSLVGMGATTPGTAVISLGTSDTFFAAMPGPVTDPNGYGHVFGNPAGGFMCLICFTNGSLAREAVMEETGLDYDGFAKAILAQTEPGNNGNLMLPYFEAETTPLILEAGARRFGTNAFVHGEDGPAAARAIVEAQAVTMKLHTAWVGETPKTIRVTGGASRNDGILQVLADVWGVDLVRLQTSNSAALGAAMMAAQGATGTAWEDLFAVFAAPVPGETKAQAACAPVYADLERRYREKLQECYGLGG